MGLAKKPIIVVCPFLSGPPSLLLALEAAEAGEEGGALTKEGEADEPPDEPIVLDDEAIGEAIGAAWAVNTAMSGASRYITGVGAAALLL